MAWWLLALKIIGYIAAFFIVRALTPKPEIPQPKGITDFDLPTAEADRCLPVVFGSVKISGPNVIWYGGLSSSTYQIKDQDAGYTYRLGVAMALCLGPVDSVTAMTVDEKNVGWHYQSTESDGHVIQHVNAPDLFGGLKVGGQGGVSGYVHVYYGTDTQNPDSYMLGKTSGQWPALRKICWVMCKGEVVTYGSLHVDLGGFYWGISEYIRPAAFYVSRCPNGLGLGSNHHRISVDGGYDSNPACMLYDILTDTTWGLGLDPAIVDVPSFQAVGETLFAESFGLAMVVDQQMAGTDLIAEILRHIDGDLCADVRTGKLVLTLVRDDYDPGDLPLFDESSISDVEMTRGSWSETTNVVKVNYTSRRDNYTGRVAQWMNTANQRIRGELVAQAIDFRGVSNATAALKIAGRCVKATSYPFARFKLKVNRKAWALRRGQPFRLTWPPLGITEMVCRVTRPSGGELQNGRISIEAIEDSFDFAGTAYTDPPASGWVDPVGPALAAAQQRLVECPYHLSPDGLRYALALAARADSSHVGFDIWSDPAGGTNFVQSASSPSFCGTGTLKASYPASTSSLDATGFIIENLIDPDDVPSTDTSGLYAGQNLALIDDEIVSWQTISGSDTTPNERTISNVLRGVLDTVPATHALGARVWLLKPGSLPKTTSAPISSELASLKVKALPYNYRNVLALADATAMTLAVSSRYIIPYPPGQIRLNGSAWPATLTAGVDVVVTWKHRNRLVQKAAGVVLSQDAGDQSASPEQGIYVVQVYVNSVVKRTVNVGTAGTWTWTAAMQTADGATPGASVLIGITAAYSSWNSQTQNRTFSMS